MIILKRRGFLTASVILLLISLSVSSAGLSLISAMNLKESSISYYDRQFIRGKFLLEEIEIQIRADLRFSTFEQFIDYMMKYPSTRFQYEGAVLNFLGSITLPEGALLHRFNLQETINGRTYVRPVQALADETGRVKLILSGIAF